MVPLLWVRLPPVPALDAGETLSVAVWAAFLKASIVLSPVFLDGAVSTEEEMGSRDGHDLRLVDDTNHAALAMLALAAVEPDGRRSVLDLVHEDGGGGGRGVRGGDEARVEATVHGLAGLVEGGLDDRVVLGPEVERDHVALGGLDGVGLEDDVAVLVTDGDGVLGGQDGASHGGGRDEGREVHYGWL